MDTTDPEIFFDNNGICNHCRQAEQLLNSAPYCLPQAQKSELLSQIIEQIKKEGKGKQYDCIVGVSGGVDSTYLAYKIKAFGLRPLAVHLDNGWDSKLAVTNVEKVLKKMDIDLFTFVINWEEFKDLQLSFLKASTPDSEIPSDHAIFSILYKAAIDYRVRYILGGMNMATESILPRRWSQGHNDWKYIASIQKRFGSKQLKTFPHRTLLRFISNKFIHRIQWINVLNYLPYVKEDAMKELKESMGWEYYGGKHYESIYTRFFQAYILPVKFGYDKRKSHLSSLIVSGQMTREAALEEMKKDIYPKEILREDMEYVLSKFDMTKDDFETIMSMPKKTMLEYPCYEKTWYFQLLHKINNSVKK
jgi:N-acetyl sugar amidotransferase